MANPPDDEMIPRSDLALYAASTSLREMAERLGGQGRRYLRLEDGSEWDEATEADLAWWALHLQERPTDIREYEGRYYYQRAALQVCPTCSGRGVVRAP